MHQGSNIVDILSMLCVEIRLINEAVYVCSICVNVPMLEAKIYSQTDMLMKLKLQRSKHGSKSARSSEQQDMLGLG